MAKGDVTLKFDAQTNQFVQAVLKARQAMEASADTARKMSDDVARAGDRTAEAMAKIGDSGKTNLEKAGNSASELASKITALGTAMGTVAAAAGPMTAAIVTGLERAQARADTLSEKVLLLNNPLAASGQLYAAPAIRQKIENIGTVGGRVVDPEEALRKFGDISGAVGNRISADDKLEATKVGLLGSAGLMSEADSARLGTNYAQLLRERRPGGGFEGADNQELENYAYQLTTGRRSELSDRDLRFFARAKDKPQAIKMLLAAEQSDESARGLSSIQQAAQRSLARET